MGRTRRLLQWRLVSVPAVFSWELVCLLTGVDCGRRFCCLVLVVLSLGVLLGVSGASFRGMHGGLCGAATSLARSCRFCVAGRVKLGGADGVVFLGWGPGRPPGPVWVCSYNIHLAVLVAYILCSVYLGEWDG